MRLGPSYTGGERTGELVATAHVRVEPLDAFNSRRHQLAGALASRIARSQPHEVSEQSLPQLVLYINRTSLGCDLV